LRIIIDLLFPIYIYIVTLLLAGIPLDKLIHHTSQYVLPLIN